MNGYGNEMRQPGTAGATADLLSATILGGGSAPTIHPCARSVKPQTSDPARLAGQAEAAEVRALAMAAWHRERAGRYLAWTDNPWAAAQYDSHAREAAYQDALAARHRQIAASLQGVRHG